MVLEENTNLEKLEQWVAMMNLLGLDVDEIYHEEDRFSCDASVDGVLETIRSIRAADARRADPDNLFRAALMTIDMQITEEDIGNYISYRDHQEWLKNMEEEVERKRIADLELAAKIDANEFIQRMYKRHKFTPVTSKQYPNQYHFEFETTKGIRVHGRLFYKAHPGNWWGNQTLHYKWRDPISKKVQMHSFQTGQLLQKLPPKGFLTEFVGPEADAMLCAYYLTIGPKRSKVNLIKPK